MLAVTSEEITVETPATRKEPAQRDTVPVARVRSGAVQVEFNRPNGPGDQSGEEPTRSGSAGHRGGLMDIDVAALRALERERDISLDVLIPAIEQALLVAYHRTDGSFRIARVELDRKSGHVIVWAREDGELLPGHGRRAAGAR